MHCKKNSITVILLYYMECFIFNKYLKMEDNSCWLFDKIIHSSEKKPRFPLFSFWLNSHTNFLTYFTFLMLLCDWKKICIFILVLCKVFFFHINIHYVEFCTNEPHFILSKYISFESYSIADNENESKTIFQFNFFL